MEKCKSRARESIIWPGISKAIEQMVQNCKICLQLLQSKRADPMMPHPVPSRPWQKIIGFGFISVWQETISNEAKRREQFQSGQMVAVQHEEIKEWSKRGRIVKKVALRSYTVKLQSGQLIRRNTRTLKRLHVVTSTSSIVISPPRIDSVVNNPLLGPGYYLN